MPSGPLSVCVAGLVPDVANLDAAPSDLVRPAVEIETLMSAKGDVGKHYIAGKS
jgi:hypothetical protein